MAVKCLKCGYIDKEFSISSKGYKIPYFGGGVSKATCRKCGGGLVNYVSN